MPQVTVRGWNAWFRNQSWLDPPHPPHQGTYSSTEEKICLLADKAFAIAMRMCVPETKNKPAAVGQPVGSGGIAAFECTCLGRASACEPNHSHTCTLFLLSPTPCAEGTKVSYANTVRPVNLLQWALSWHVTFTMSNRAPIYVIKNFSEFHFWHISVWAFLMLVSNSCSPWSPTSLLTFLLFYHTNSLIKCKNCWSADTGYRGLILKKTLLYSLIGL